VVAESIVAVVKQYLSRVADAGVDVRFGVVYGSQATGRSDRWSDIDLLVVSPLYDGPYTYEDTALLWRLSAEIDSRIEPIPCGEKRWVHDDGTPLVEIARQEGQVVALDELQGRGPAGSP